MYSLFSCNADDVYSSYYINDDDECFASIYEGSTGAGIMANALWYDSYCFLMYSLYCHPLTLSPKLVSCKEITSSPTDAPTFEPTPRPTRSPSEDPTKVPTHIPTHIPTNIPTDIPTLVPTLEPTSDPTLEPTKEPTNDPTTAPTVEPSISPTEDPTARPTTPHPTFVVPEVASPTFEPTIHNQSDQVEVLVEEFNGDIPWWIWAVMASLTAICICCLIVAVFVYRREEANEKQKSSMADLVAKADLGVQMSGSSHHNVHHHIQTQSASSGDAGMFGANHMTAGHGYAGDATHEIQESTGNEPSDDDLYDSGDPAELIRGHTAGRGGRTRSAGGPHDEITNDGAQHDNVSNESNETDSDHDDDDDVIHDLNEGGDPMMMNDGTTLGGPTTPKGGASGSLDDNGDIDVLVRQTSDSNEDIDMDAMYEKGNAVTKGGRTTLGPDDLINTATDIGDPAVTAGHQ